MLGCNRFTREGIHFNAREAMNLLMMFNGVNENELTKNAESEKGITNFDILTQIMPPLSMKYKTKAFKEDKDDPKTSNAILEIRNGKYIRGQMDKGVLGAGTKGLLQRICNDFGNMASAKFIDDLQNVVTEYMKSTAFSVGISDLISDQKTNEEIVKIITQKKYDVKLYITESKNIVLELLLDCKEI
jgi:DNA-directed RNA polymerase II subunit RPB1